MIKSRSQVLSGVGRSCLMNHSWWMGKVENGCVVALGQALHPLHRDLGDVAILPGQCIPIRFSDCQEPVGIQNFV